MSFTMKYDKNGRPIPSASDFKEQVVEQPAPVVEMAAEQIERPEIDNSTVDNLATLQSNETQANQEVQAPAPQANEKEAEPLETVSASVLRQKAARAEKAERERDELLRLIKEQQQQRQPEPEDNDEINLGPDDLAEGKHLSKIEKKYKKLEKQLAQYQQISNEKIIENRIKTEYPDFDKVVNPDNLDVFRTAFPEIAHTLSTSNDLYNKAVTAYTLIKKLGISPEAQTELNKAKVAENIAKPRPLLSIQPQKGNTPLEQANPFAQGLTKDLRDQLRREMEIARKQR